MNYQNHTVTGNFLDGLYSNAFVPKVVGSIPTVARHIFQACPVWYTLRVTSQASYSPEYITPTQHIS
jgi:hypothetical protein